MVSDERFEALEQRVAALEQFSAEVKMVHFADWMDGHGAEVAACLRTGEPITMPETGAVITKAELLGLLDEVRP